jgi:hypothetical protein
MAYDGPDRRIHKIFVTRNTEYHLRRDVCVGVRDRRTGAWVPGHDALHRTVAGSLTFLPNGGYSGDAAFPGVGEALCFQGTGLVTGAVVAVERPARDVVTGY